MEGEMLGNGTIVHEVKRVGLLIDRYVDLELRIGDHLVIYISKSQAWDKYNLYILIWFERFWIMNNKDPN